MDGWMGTTFFFSLDSEAAKRFGVCVAFYPLGFCWCSFDYFPPWTHGGRGRTPDTGPARWGRREGRRGFFDMLQIVHVVASE